MTATRRTERSAGPRAPGQPRGPKPLDAKLPREVIAVPAPELKALFCPQTADASGQLQPGFTDVLEVLAHNPAMCYPSVQAGGVREPAPDGARLLAVAGALSAALSSTRLQSAWWRTSQRRTLAGTGRITGWSSNWRAAG